MSDLISTQLRKGTVFAEQGNVYLVLDYKHVKKGRGLATVRVKVKDVEGGAIVEKTYTSNEKVSSVSLAFKSAQFLYHDENNSHFMDSEDYSQYKIDSSIINWQKNFLVEGQKVKVLKLEEKIIGIECPIKVKLKVKYTEPGTAGDTVGKATKQAELETGFKLQVPLFIKKGDVIIVNTEKGNYVSKG